MARILLIPSDHGGGMGHVSRCLYLAKLFNENGHETSLVLEQKHYKQFSSQQECYLLKTAAERFVKYQAKRPLKPAVRLKQRLYKRPVFVEFNGLCYQVPRDGYLSTKLVRFRLRRLLKIVDEFKPDLLVGDGHFLCWLAGQIRKIPIVQITRLAGYPPAPDFSWWQKEESSLIAPDGLAPFRPLLEHLDLSDKVEKTEDLLQGNTYLVPAIPEVEPLPGSASNVVFSGPLNAKKEAPKTGFFQDDLDYPKIYVTIGGGAGRSREKVFFDALIDTFDKKEYQVLVSTGRRVSAATYKKRSLNIHFEDWVDGAAAIGQSDLVVFHGGYGTMLEILDAARPAIVLPSHSEQQGNGQRLQELNLGRQLNLAREKSEMAFTWPYGEYSMGARFDFSFPAQELLQSTQELLYGSAFERAKEISRKLQQARENFDVNKLLDV